MNADMPKQVGDDRALIAWALPNYAEHIERQRKSENVAIKALYGSGQKDAERCRALAKQHAPQLQWAEAGSRGALVQGSGYLPIKSPPPA